MYFIRYNPLKEKLRNRSLSDREALPYFALLSALTAFMGAIPAEAYNEWDYLSVVLSVIFAIGGVIYAYKCNGAKDGSDLILKYIVLGWVVVIRCSLVFIPAIIVYYMIAHTLGLVSDSTGILDVVIIAIFEIVLYQRIGRHIRDTHQIPCEQNDGVNKT